MIIVVLFTLGLCLGSFTNALVWRVHEQAKPKKKRVAKDNELSIIKGRSMCTHCQHTLAWYDLMPVLSWLSLGGKCRYCRKPIGWQYPLMEVLTALMVVLSYIYWPVAPQGAQLLLFGIWLALLVGFMSLIIYDMRWMLLPDRVVFPMQGIAAVFALIVLLSSKHLLHDSLWLALALACTAGLFYVLHVVSDGKWIGGGDVKLGVVLGLVLADPAKSFLMLFIASLLGTILAIPLFIKGKAKRNSKLPFGPLLIIATIIVYLFGASMIAWYRQRFLTI